MSSNTVSRCSRCGAALRPGAHFCPRCDAPVTPTSGVPPAPSRSSSSGQLKWVAAGAALGLLIIVIVATVLFIVQPNSNSGLSPAPNVLATPTAPPVASTPTGTPTAVATAAPVITAAATSAVEIPTATYFPTLAPTSVPPPTFTSVPPTVACINNALFVSDVTIPDGTVLNPGQAFVKIWRLQNTGNCGWDSLYSLTFTGGEQMSGASPQAVTITPPNGTVDVAVSMIAPGAPGSHTGQWQMKAPNGAFFGSTVTVIVVVPSPATAVPAPTSIPTGVPPTPVPTNPPLPAACSGTPNIAFFNASPTTINAGGSSTLSWGAVTNATSATIDQGIGGVPTPGSIVVSPGGTTTYTLTAYCAVTGSTSVAQVTVNVNAGPPPPPNRVSPGNGAVLHNYPRNATFTWNPVNYPGGVTYNIEIQINTGSWQAWRLQTGIGGTSYYMNSFAGDNQGRWRVWSTSPSTGDGPKSGWWGFSFHTGP
jgi:hypothetical protein